MAEKLSRDWQTMRWTKDPLPLLDALDAAIEAGSLDGVPPTIRVRWKGREGEYESTQEARVALNHATKPVEISLWLSDPDRVSVLISAAESGYLGIRVNGSDFGTATRAFEAAKRVLTESALKGSLLPKPVLARLSEWANNHQGLIALVAIVVGIITAVVIALLTG